ncbi:MAG: hypothetical protein DRP71_03380 [Verrucomicrobia bacterium]|nr:MAG: hypothetical protein DRP71_03380 [Verrucomicrobiota bacterium]
MIDPTAPSLQSMVVTHKPGSDSTPTRAIDERPAESLTAPNGSEAEIHFHRGLIAAAEREFGRLLVRIELLLQPVA